MFSLAPDRKVLVAGGAGGMGLCVADRLLGLGASVAIADVSDDALKEAAERLASPRLYTTRMDVSNESSVTAAVADVVTAHGGLDTLVNCAGVLRFNAIEDVTVEEWDWVLDINLRGTFLTCRAAVPHLRASGRGRIVNIASDAGKRGAPATTAYCASKFGVIGLTEALAAELGPSGILVNSVCPSTVPTTGMGRVSLGRKIEMGWGSDEQVLERERSMRVLQRLGTPDDIADAILFLLSENSTWITGTSLGVDGGVFLGYFGGGSDQ